VPILTDEERIHTTIAGKYRIDRILARGGMGVVFVGEHTWTRRPVAVKLVSPFYAQNPEASARFLREARAAAMLRHPNAVDVLDMGETDDGSLFLVLELLEGTDVADLLERRVKLSPRESAEIIAPILDVLSVLHEKGFVHRDLKPSNIFIAHGAAGRLTPKLLDFGLVKALRPDDASRATRAGVIMGTPQYMSPEQASGARDLGHPADLWAIGAILYELTSGTVPFDGDSPTATLMAIISSDAKPLASVVPDVPEAFAKLVDAALARAPSARPRDARTFAEQLRASVGLGAAIDFEGKHEFATLPRTTGARRRAEVDTASDGPAFAITAEAGAVTPREASEKPAPAATETAPAPHASRTPLALGLLIAAVLVVAVSLAATKFAGGAPAAPTAMQTTSAARMEQVARDIEVVQEPVPVSVPVAGPVDNPVQVAEPIDSPAQVAEPPTKRRPATRDHSGRPITKVQTRW
jgi:eukaryotic-like serine/threonine-protein kinase